MATLLRDLGCDGAAPRAGPHDRGLRPERPCAAFAGAARRQPDRLRRLRHRRGRGARLRSPATPTSIVLDHHKAEGPPPAVLATVNPNRLDCTSGLTLLCAAAVAFLAAVATVRTLRRQGFFAAAQGARPDRPARPGGAGDGVRRDAADRGEPRAGLPGAEGDGAPRPARHRRAARRGAGARPADRVHLRLRAGPAHQRRRAHQRGRSRAAAAAVRGPGGGGVAGRPRWMR